MTVRDGHAERLRATLTTLQCLLQFRESFSYAPDDLQLIVRHLHALLYQKPSIGSEFSIAILKLLGTITSLEPLQADDTDYYPVVLRRPRMEIYLPPLTPPYVDVERRRRRRQQPVVCGACPQLPPSSAHSCETTTCGDAYDTDEEECADEHGDVAEMGVGESMTHGHATHSCASCPFACTTYADTLAPRTSSLLSSSCPHARVCVGDEAAPTHAHMWYPKHSTSPPCPGCRGQGHACTRHNRSSSLHCSLRRVDRFSTFATGLWPDVVLRVLLHNISDFLTGMTSFSAEGLLACMRAVLTILGRVATTPYMTTYLPTVLEVGEQLMRCNVSPAVSQAHDAPTRHASSSHTHTHTHTRTHAHARANVNARTRTKAHVLLSGYHAHAHRRHSGDAHDNDTEEDEEARVGEEEEESGHHVPRRTRRHARYRYDDDDAHSTRRSASRLRDRSHRLLLRGRSGRDQRRRRDAAATRIAESCDEAEESNAARAWSEEAANRVCDSSLDVAVGEETSRQRVRLCRRGRSMGPAHHRHRGTHTGNNRNRNRSTTNHTRRIHAVTTTTTTTTPAETTVLNAASSAGVGSDSAVVARAPPAHRDSRFAQQLRILMLHRLTHMVHCMGRRMAGLYPVVHAFLLRCWHTEDRLRGVLPPYSP